MLLYAGDSQCTWAPYTSSVLWHWLQSLHLTPSTHHLPASWKHVRRGERQHLQKAVEKIHPNPPWLAQRMETGRRWFKQLYNSEAEWGDVEADGAATGKHIWASNFCPASLTMVQKYKNLYSALPGLLCSNSHLKAEVCMLKARADVSKALSAGSTVVLWPQCYNPRQS